MFMFHYYLAFVFELSGNTANAMAFVNDVDSFMRNDIEKEKTAPSRINDFDLS